MFNAAAAARDRRVLRPVPTLSPHFNPVGTGVIGEQTMNKLIADLRTLSSTDRMIVVATPLAGVVLSAAFFFS